MIVKTIDANRLSVLAQDADDILGMRRVICAGDHITGDTTRVIKRDREHARPDRGERTAVRIVLDVQKVSMDAVDRLRVSGSILESSNEAVPHGTHHSMNIMVGEPYTIHKKAWSTAQKKILRGRGEESGYVLVAIDRNECGIAKLTGARVEIIPNIYSGMSGKRYKTEQDPAKFLRQACAAISNIAGSQTVIMFGPGETKKKAANLLDKTVRVVDGIDSGGEDGIHLFVKSEAMRKTISDSKMAAISRIIENIMEMAARRGRRFAMGFNEVRAACNAGAIESLVFSDAAFENGEQKVIDLLNVAESGGGRVYGADMSTDLGKRVAGLGGMVAVLRFAVSG